MLPAALLGHDDPVLRHAAQRGRFGVEATPDQIGEAVVIGTAALFAAHGVGKSVQRRLAARQEHRPGPAGEHGGVAAADGGAAGDVAGDDA